MGTSIGSTSRAIAALPPARDLRSVRGVTSNQSAEKPGQLVREKEIPEIRAGFGEGTLSPSGAALKTLDANLRAAEQLVPTVEELRERARIAQARRDEAAAAGDSNPVEFRQPERVRPEANPAVRNFVREDTQFAEAQETPERETEAVQPAPPEAPPVNRNPPGTRLNLQA
jgi:hypothetical protein